MGAQRDEDKRKTERMDGVMDEGRAGRSGGAPAPAQDLHQLCSDELLSGSPQEEQEPLIRLFSRRPRVSFTPPEPALPPGPEKWSPEEVKRRAGGAGARAGLWKS